MKEPTKKLLNITKRHVKAKRKYREEIRTYIQSAEPLDTEMFWNFLEYYAKDVRSRMQYTAYNPFKSAAHNTILEIYKSVIDGDMNGWARAARFLATYQHFSDKLSKKCWDMDSGKGDDGYGDWMDALPLAGKAVIECILADDLATYRQIDQAVQENSPNLHDIIMEGENYIKSTFEEELINHFSYIVTSDERARNSEDMVPTWR